jgi:hypothetical protein
MLALPGHGWEWADVGYVKYPCEAGACAYVWRRLFRVSQGMYAHLAVLRPVQWRRYAEAFASQVRLFSNPNLGPRTQQQRAVMAS